MKGNNLRGRTALVKVDGQVCKVTIVTHIRGDIWMVEGDALPVKYQRYYDSDRRVTTVKRRALVLVDEPEP